MILAIQEKKLARSYIHSGSFALSNLVIKKLLRRVTSNWPLREIVCKKRKLLTRVFKMYFWRDFVQSVIFEYSINLVKEETLTKNEVLFFASKGLWTL